MRLLEIFMVICLTVTFTWPALFPGRRNWIWGAFLALVATGFHLFVEGYRWQMVPLYALVLFADLSALFTLFRWLPENKSAYSRRWTTLLPSLLLLLLLGFVTALPVLLPLPSLPKPTGPYAVGTYSQMLVDDARREIYSTNPQDARRIMIQVWYPADPTPGLERAAWVEDIEIVGPAISQWLGLPSFFLDHVRYARTHAWLEAPMATPRDLEDRGGYPVLLFSHGWSGFRAQNTYQMEELASYGYVVVALEHTYAAIITAFPDGSVAEHNPAGLPRGVTDREFLVAARRLSDQWAEDMRFVLDTIEAWNTIDPKGLLAGRLDMERVGVLGHSTGGGAVIELCARDARCKAGLAMDAYIVPVSQSVLDHGVQQPFLFLFSELWSIPNNTERLSRFRQNLSPDNLYLRISGAAHYDFTDMPMLSPLAQMLGLKGPIPGPRALQITNTYSLAFFDRALRGQAAPLLDAPSPEYPEVTFER